MEQNEILEGNKLIAEFMQSGWYQAYRKDGYKPHWVDRYASESECRLAIGKHYKAIEHDIEPKYCYPDEYNTSWDWIVPVVIKINNICRESGRELSNNSKSQEHLSNPLDNPLHWKSWSYHYINLSELLDENYKKVIQFIQWHNANNPKNKSHE